MSTTLTLIEAGWESIRLTAARGHRTGALDRLARLLERPDLPPATAAEGHRLAGELALDLGRYSAARRHLRAAAKLEPTHAGVRFLMGRAWEEDPNGCDRRAARCFKKSVTLAAEALPRAHFGRAAARCGKVKLGTRELLAAAAGSGERDVVRVVVCGLLEAGRADDARRVLAAVRFLHPGDGELAAMWELVKFETARLGQLKRARAARRENVKPRYAQEAHFATEGDRVTLPFLRLADDTNPAQAGGTVRRDAASFPRPHLARLGLRKADR
jgi:hypothetical protein